MLDFKFLLFYQWIEQISVIGPILTVFYFAPWSKVIFVLPEDETVKQADRSSNPAPVWDGEQWKPNAYCIEGCVNNRQQENWSDIVKEWPYRHEVSSIEDYWWKKVDKENIGIEGILGGWGNMTVVKDASNNQTKDN